MEMSHCTPCAQGWNAHSIPWALVLGVSVHVPVSGGSPSLEKGTCWGLWGCHLLSCLTSPGWGCPHLYELSRGSPTLGMFFLAAGLWESCKALGSQFSQLIFPLPPLQACRDFLDLAETHSRKWHRALQYEREQRIRLEETIEQLAKQHNSLERACRGAPGSTGSTGTAKGEPSGWGWGGGTGSALCESAAPLDHGLLVLFQILSLLTGHISGHGVWRKPRNPQMLLNSQLQRGSCPNWDSFAACKSYLSGSKIKWLLDSSAKSPSLQEVFVTAWWPEAACRAVSCFKRVYGLKEAVSCWRIVPGTGAGTAAA